MKSSILTVYLLGWALYGSLHLNHNFIKGLVEGLSLPGVFLDAFLPGPPNGFVICVGSGIFWLLFATIGERRRPGAIAIPEPATGTTRVWRRRFRIYRED